MRYIRQPCRSKYNTATNHNCCVLWAIEWDRLGKNVRISVDARGETDLPHPKYSCLTTFESQTRANIDELEKDARPLYWIPDREVPGHYKGRLIFHDAVARYSSSLTLFFWFASSIEYPFIPLFQTITVESQSARSCTNLLDQVRWDSHRIYGCESLFANDTPEMEQERWNNVVPNSVLDRVGTPWWV
jgi:hypothetical protein